MQRSPLLSRLSRTALAALALACLVAVPAAQAAVTTGEVVPDFTLTAADGETHSLSDFRGKTVVLEWVNHDCPFVKKHYGAGNMQALQKKYTDEGVVWLSINSSAEGKQGHVTPAEAMELTKEKDAVPTAVLLDADGSVGRTYGARTTPHMYIIDPQGKLVYNGAIDDRPTADPADIEEATNYVSQALGQLMAGEAIAIATTKPYGCSVKY